MWFINTCPHQHVYTCGYHGFTNMQTHVVYNHWRLGFSHGIIQYAHTYGLKPLS